MSPVAERHDIPALPARMQNMQKVFVLDRALLTLRSNQRRNGGIDLAFASTDRRAGLDQKRTGRHRRQPTRDKHPSRTEHARQVLGEPLTAAICVT